MEELKAIGFWKDKYEDKSLPNPRMLISYDWNPTIKKNIVKYLQSGIESCSYLGYSWCRFNCGIKKSEMGCLDLTDGEWVWPQGLPHYVEQHNIALPEEFILFAGSNNYIIPQLNESIRLSNRINFQLWIKWYKGYLNSKNWFQRLIIRFNCA